MKNNSTPISAFCKITNDKRFRDSVATADGHGCENWTGGAFANGYGRFWASGKNLYAHRYAYCMHNKIDHIPDDLYVLHSCDNRLCTAKAHLRLGTPKENSTDMATRNRSTKGRLKPKKAFTQSDVDKIILMSAQGLTPYRIAKMTERSQPVIAGVLKRNSSKIEAKKTELLKNKVVSILEPLNESMQACIANLRKIAA